MILFYVCAQQVGLFFIMLNNEQSAKSATQEMMIVAMQLGT